MSVIQNMFNIESDNSSKRIYYLDFARGILILLVLYHHAMAPFHPYILQFHMPALFILSGYTEFLLDKQKTFWVYVKSKFFRLIIPYFCFEILNLVFYALLRCFWGEIDFSFTNAFISIITCINNSYMGLYGRLWFLPAIFVASIFSYVIKQISKNKTYMLFLICVLMFVISYMVSAALPYRLPFTVDIAFLGTAFFLLGHICGKALNYIFESKNHWFILLLLIFFSGLFVLCNIIANPVCYMYINQYADFPFMILCAISGTIISFIAAKYLFMLFSKITFFTNIVFWYSINSLAVFPIHLTIKVLSIPLFESIGLNNWICLFATMFLGTIPIVNIINNYFPFILGISKRKKV